MFDRLGLTAKMGCRYGFLGFCLAPMHGYVGVTFLLSGVPKPECNCVSWIRESISRVSAKQALFLVHAWFELCRMLNTKIFDA